jgi:hypothetical protein
VKPGSGSEAGSEAGKKQGGSREAGRRRLEDLVSLLPTQPTRQATGNRQQRTPPRLSAPPKCADAPMHSPQPPSSRAHGEAAAHRCPPLTIPCSPGMRLTMRWLLGQARPPMHTFAALRFVSHPTHTRTHTASAVFCPAAPPAGRSPTDRALTARPSPPHHRPRLRPVARRAARPPRAPPSPPTPAAPPPPRRPARRQRPGHPFNGRPHVRFDDFSFLVRWPPCACVCVGGGGGLLMGEGGR